jgi:hypothetical protein
MGRRRLLGVLFALVALSLPVVPAGGAPQEAASFTVTPATDLVHGQQVVLEGAGWTSDRPILFVQCAAGATTFGECEHVRDAFAGGAGTFHRTARVDVLVDAQDALIDCRVAACELLAVPYGSNGFDLGGAVRAALAFDPAGPDPSRRPLTVDPDTGLVDGQLVHLTGTGFPTGQFGGFLTVVQCEGDDPVAAGCDWGTASLRGSGPDGAVDAQVPVNGLVVRADGTSVDCRAAACSLVTIYEDDDLSESSINPLDFDPGAPLRPDPTITLTPGPPYQDGDLVHIVGEGFDPLSEVSVGQCEVGATDWQGCDLDPGYLAQVDADGGVDTWMGMYAVLERYADHLDCRQDACSIIVAQSGAGGFEPFGRRADVPTLFDPAGPLLTPQASVSPSTGLHDGSVVTVSGTGFHPLDGVWAMLCPAGADWFDRCSLDFDNDFPTSDAPTEVVEREPAGPRSVTGQDPESRRFVLLPESRGDADNDFSGDMELVAEFTNDYGRHVDCTQEACEVMVMEAWHEDVQAHVPVEFARADGADPAAGPVAASPAFTG